jgi:hypothetical protein
MASEDGAMIESPTMEPFRVSLANCNPQSIETTPTPTPTSVVRMGETNILGGSQSGLGNVLVAQQTTLAQNGTLQSLSFYVSQASGQVVLGVYDDAGGQPGTLRGQTAPFTPGTGWNTQSVLTPAPLTAGTYWLAVLPQSNSLTFRGEATGLLWGYIYPFGAMPATPPAPVGSAAGHWSFYATLAAETGGQISASALPAAGEAAVRMEGEAGYSSNLFLPLVRP